MPNALSPLSALALKLVEIPSVTGNELEVLGFLEGLAAQEGLTCTRIAVDERRFNLLIHHPDAKPRILLSTHVDTVPGGPRAEIRDGVLHGRGSCDAKGIAASMWFACLDLLEEGHRHTGLLWVVGEETNSDGAKAAARGMEAVEFILNGEPTELQFVAAQKGVVAGTLLAKGKSAHSGYPELGHSAIHSLLDVLGEVRAHAWPADAVVGPTLVNVGVLAGGTAANVLAAEAHADFLVRVSSSAREVIATLERLVEGRASLELRTASDPQILLVPEGEPRCVVGFGSDVPHLRPLGTPLMMGPGSIHHAHTDHEHVTLADLEIARRKYREVALRLAAG